MRLYTTSSAFRIALLAVLAVAAGCGERHAETPADLVLRNGSFYTVDDARSWAQAVAITSGRFSYVGNDAGARAFVGSNTGIVDLGGRMVLPGMFDVHIHALGSGLEVLACDPSAEAILEEHGEFPEDAVGEYLARIKRCAENQPDAEWVTGAGWLMDAFGPGAKASRKLLDEIVPDRPVYMETSDGHTAWVNSKALEIAGITAETPDPPNGIIDREPGSRVPLGSLQEHAQDLVEDLIPPPDLETKTAALQYAVNMLNEYGITSIQDAKTYRNFLDGYRALDDRGELTLPYIKPESVRWMYPIGSLQRDGAVVVSGSDWSVSSANPFLQMETAITRTDPLSDEGEAFIPDERVSLADVIPMLTINAAWVNHSENETGSIEVGKYADLAVLDQNLFDIAVYDISKTQVLLTLFGGEAVHGSLADF